MMTAEEMENWDWEQEDVRSATTVEGMLKQFISTFEASVDPRLWMKLVEEETKELEEALEGTSRREILKETTDLMYVTIGFNLTSAGPEQIGLFSSREYDELMGKLKKASEVHEKAMDRLGDTNHFEAFRRIHLSNMSKLDDSGKPIKREDGKILKGPNYKEPNLEDLI